MQIAWMPSGRVSQIVECTAHRPASGRLPPTLGTDTALTVAAVSNNLGWWQVFNTYNPFGCIRNVFARTNLFRHFEVLQKVLPPLKLSEKFLQDLRKRL
jgi:hypothetical protein